MAHLSTQSDLKLLSNSALHEQTKLKAKAERMATTELLSHIVEVQRRKLFAELGYESLYAFCVRDLMMSEGDAVRYKNASFLMRDCPEIEEKIIDGSLCFTNVAHIAAHVKAENRAGFEISLEQKKELVAQIESTSTRKAERILLSHAKRPIADVKETVRAISESTAELRTPIDDEFAAIIDRLKQIWSHSMPGASIGEILKRAAQVALHHEDPLEKAKRAVAKKEAREAKLGYEPKRSTKSQRSASTSLGFAKLVGEEAADSGDRLLESRELPKSENSALSDLVLKQTNQFAPPTRYIEKPVDHQLWLRDEGQCTHVDTKGERCTAKHFVQRDHIIPFADAGPNTLGNLTLRCFAHNQQRAKQRFGAEKVARRSTVKEVTREYGVA